MKNTLAFFRGAMPAILCAALAAGTYGADRGSVANAVNDFGGIVGARYTEDNTIVPRATFWLRDILVIDLGTFRGGTFSEALAVNNFGQVVGYSTTADGSTHAFLWHFGVMRDLGTLGPDYHYSRANGINDRGEVVGVSCKQDQSVMIPHNPMPPTDPSCRAFLWRRGHMENLGVYPGGNFSMAVAINNHGQIVGSGDLFASDAPYGGAFETRALVWAQGKLTVLGPDRLCLCDTFGSAINERGTVTGFYVGSGDNFAAYWTAGREAHFARLGGDDRQLMFTTGINNKGQIVGVSPYSLQGPILETTIAFLYEHGKVMPLALSPTSGVSAAQGINESGLIVGWDNGRAVMWEHGVEKPLK